MKKKIDKYLLFIVGFLALVAFGPSLQIFAQELEPSYISDEIDGTYPKNGYTVHREEEQVINYGTKEVDNWFDWNKGYRAKKYAEETTTPGLFDVTVKIQGEQQTAVTKQKIDCMIVYDYSSSMSDSRLSAANTGVKTFLSTLEQLGAFDPSGVGNLQIGFVTFGTDVPVGNLVTPLGSSKEEILGKLPTKTTSGQYTFTQAGLRYADEELRNHGRGDSKKIVLLLTDGLPTKAYPPRSDILNGNSELLKEEEIPATQGYDTPISNEIGKVTSSGLSSYTQAELLSQNTYIPFFEPKNPYTTTNVTNYKGELLPLFTSGTVYKTAQGGEIRTTWQGTISEAYRMKQGIPFNEPLEYSGTKMPIEIYTVGIELIHNQDSADVALKSLAKQAVYGMKAISGNQYSGGYQSDGEHYYVDATPAEKVSEALKEIGVELSSTVQDGKLVDPLGETVFLDSTSPIQVEIINQKTGEIEQDAKEPLVEERDDKIYVSNITLTEEQELRLKYKVHLKTESESFKANYWYQANGETLFQPTSTSEFYSIGVPSIRGEGTEISIEKKWEDEENRLQLRPPKISLQLGRTSDSLSGNSWNSVNFNIEGKMEQNVWKTTLKEIKIGENTTNLAKYDNFGNPINYFVMSETLVKGYKTKIQNEEKLIVKNTLIRSDIIGKKVDKVTDEGIKGAKIKIESMDGPSFSLDSVSDEKGEFIFKNIPPGNYLVKEVVPPKGYQIENQDYFVKVELDGSVTSEKELVITNEKLEEIAETTEITPSTPTSSESKNVGGYVSTNESSTIFEGKNTKERGKKYHKNEKITKDKKEADKKLPKANENRFFSSMLKVIGIIIFLLICYLIFIINKKKN